MPSQLPLFPLRIVLFPGALLPLHIFEPRYRQLLADITIGDQRFGILPPGEDGGLPAPGTMGCEARVRGVRQLAGGRANIVVSGEARIRLVEGVRASTPYYQGVVEAVHDLPDVQVPGENDLERLRALGERYAHALQSLTDEPLDLRFSSGPGELSFEVAALLEGEFDTRQRLLESRSALERIARLLHALPVLVHHAEERASVHGRAKRNGHGAIL